MVEELETAGAGAQNADSGLHFSSRGLPGSGQGGRQGRLECY